MSLVHQNIPALTGIRGVAAFLVVLFHLEIDFARNCWLGVDLFFILSGFILAHVHTELKEPTVRKVHSFLILRFFRVYPLHLAALLAIAALVSAFPGFVAWQRSLPGMGNSYSLGGFIQTLTLTNRVGLRDLGQWNGPSWSLSSETLAYLFFPALVVIVNRIRRALVCYAYSAASLSLFCLFMMRGHDGVARVILTFPVGVALCRATHLQTLRQPSWISIFSCAWIALCLSSDISAPLAVFGFAALIRGLAEDTGAIAKIMSSKPVMFLGKISFSLYLTHQTVLLFMSWLDRSDAAWKAASLGASLLLASVAYYLIELPSHRAGRKIAHRRRERSVLISSVQART